MPMVRLLFAFYSSHLKKETSEWYDDRERLNILMNATSLWIDEFMYVYFSFH
jgi:hypothetical protein